MHQLHEQLWGKSSFWWDKSLKVGGVVRDFIAFSHSSLNVLLKFKCKTESLPDWHVSHSWLPSLWWGYSAWQGWGIILVLFNPPAQSRISFSTFPIFSFSWRWLTPASPDFSQLLAWLFIVMIGHRGAGELNTASLEGRAGWPEDMAFLACWTSRSFFSHLSEGLSPAFWRHGLSLLPHLSA